MVAVGFIPRIIDGYTPRSFVEYATGGNDSLKIRGMNSPSTHSYV